eukprot:GHRR01033415.1.p1 GENE.GHRR01033415.1~~GHRR01033415.1.p1  ORF type:complete len:341 (-),score=23.05 GHRR01033415.1:7-1029(-)
MRISNSSMWSCHGQCCIHKLHTCDSPWVALRVVNTANAFCVKSGQYLKGVLVCHEGMEKAIRTLTNCNCCSARRVQDCAISFGIDLVQLCDLLDVNALTAPLTHALLALDSATQFSKSRANDAVLTQQQGSTQGTHQLARQPRAFVRLISSFGDLARFPQHTQLGLLPPPTGPMYCNLCATAWRWLLWNYRPRACLLVATSQHLLPGLRVRRLDCVCGQAKQTRCCTASGHSVVCSRRDPTAHHQQSHAAQWAPADPAANVRPSGQKVSVLQAMHSPLLPAAWQLSNVSTSEVPLPSCRVSGWFPARACVYSSCCSDPSSTSCCIRPSQCQARQHRCEAD